MNKNKAVLDQVVKYCKEHPEMRFWEALKSMINAEMIGVFFKQTTHGVEDLEDTQYWEGLKE